MRWRGLTRIGRDVDTQLYLVKATHGADGKGKVAQQLELSHGHPGAKVRICMHFRSTNLNCILLMVPSIILQSIIFHLIFSSYL